MSRATTRVEGCFGRFPSGSRATSLLCSPQTCSPSAAPHAAPERDRHRRGGARTAARRAPESPESRERGKRERRRRTYRVRDDARDPVRSGTPPTADRARTPTPQRFRTPEPRPTSCPTLAHRRAPSHRARGAHHMNHEHPVATEPAATSADRAFVRRPDTQRWGRDPERRIRSDRDGRHGRHRNRRPQAPTEERRPGSIPQRGRRGEPDREVRDPRSPPRIRRVRSQVRGSRSGSSQLRYRSAAATPCSRRRSGRRRPGEVGHPRQPRQATPRTRTTPQSDTDADTSAERPTPTTGEAGTPSAAPKRRRRRGGRGRGGGGGPRPATTNGADGNRADGNRAADGSRSSADRSAGNDRQREDDVEERADRPAPSGGYGRNRTPSPSSTRERDPSASRTRERQQRPPRQRRYRSRAPTTKHPTIPPLTPSATTPCPMARRQPPRAPASAAVAAARVPPSGRPPLRATTQPSPPTRWRRSHRVAPAPGRTRSRWRPVAPPVACVPAVRGPGGSAEDGAAARTRSSCRGSRTRSW